MKIPVRDKSSGSFICPSPLQGGSGFQRLLADEAKSSGPKVLKGLPIRQRAPSSRPADQRSPSPTQRAEPKAQQQAQSNAAEKHEPERESSSLRKTTSPTSADDSRSQTLRQDNTDTAVEGSGERAADFNAELTNSEDKPPRPPQSWVNCIDWQACKLGKTNPQHQSIVADISDY